MKKYPYEGSEKYLKSCACKVWEPFEVTACLLHNELATYIKQPG